MQTTIRTATVDFEHWKEAIASLLVGVGVIVTKVWSKNRNLSLLALTEEVHNIRIGVDSVLDEVRKNDKKTTERIHHMEMIHARDYGILSTDVENLKRAHLGEA